MLNLLVPLGIVVPLLMIYHCSSRWYRGSWECLFLWQGAERWSSPFLHGLLVIQILLCSKGQCRIQWKQGRFWIRNEQYGNGEELGCELAVTLGKDLVSLFSLACQEMWLSRHSTQKRCHSLSCSKHLALLPLGNFLNHWIL